MFVLEDLEIKRTYEFWRWWLLVLAYHLCSQLLGPTEDAPTPRLVKPFIVPAYHNCALIPRITRYSLVLSVAVNYAESYGWGWHCLMHDTVWCVFDDCVCTWMSHREMGLRNFNEQLWSIHLVFGFCWYGADFGVKLLLLDLLNLVFSLFKRLKLFLVSLVLKSIHVNICTDGVTNI